MPAHTRTERLLIVDDETELLDALCDALRDAGFDAIGCAVPGDALAAVRGGRFALLLSDQMMPGMSGTELLRRARQVEPELVGLIMTGQGSPQAEAEARAAGAVGLIRKPFRMRQVLPILEQALGAGGAVR